MQEAQDAKRHTMLLAQQEDRCADLCEYPCLASRLMSVTRAVLFAFITAEYLKPGKELPFKRCHEHRFRGVYSCDTRSVVAVWQCLQ